MFFQIMLRLRADLNILKSGFADFIVTVEFVGVILKTARRIDAYDISLESCKNCTCFSSRQISQIINSFDLIFNILKTQVVVGKSRI
jgi:hypothetical protein